MGEQYFNEIVDRLNSVHISQRNNLHYVPRNVWFYSLLLQKQRGTIERSKLYQLIGTQFKDRIDTTIDEAPEDCVIRQGNADEDGEGFLTMKAPLIKAVEAYFDREYDISRVIPHFGQMHGKRFIRRLNRLAPQPHGGLILPVSSFLNETLEARFEPVDNYVQNLDLTLEDQLVVDTLRVVRTPRRISPEWKLLLCVYTYPGALSQEDVDHLCNVLRWFSMQADHCPVLLFTTSVNAVRATDILGHDEQIHFMWAFSALRLLQGIPSIIEKYGDVAIATFPAVFTPQMQQTLSAKQALSNWVHAIEEQVNPPQPSKKKP